MFGSVHVDRGRDPGAARRLESPREFAKLADVYISRLLLPLALCACAAPGEGESGPVVSEGPPGWTVIGTSVGGLPILTKTRGSGGRRVYLIAGIHGDERPAVENAERLSVLVDTNLPPGVTVRLVEDVNPDGTRAGTRGNARGVDINRNWPAQNFTPHSTRGPRPLSEPEAAAIHADLTRFDPSLVIVLHAARRGPFVNYDGPAREAATRFVQAAVRFDPGWRVVADMGYATPGSLGSWVGEDGQVPTLTVELRRGAAADEMWPALRAGLLAVFAAGDPRYVVE